MHGLDRPITRQLPPKAQRIAEVLRPSRRRAGGRVRLAARRQLAGGDARARGARSSRSAPTWRPRTPIPRAPWPTRRRCRRRSMPRCARASRRTTARCRRPTAPSSTSPATSPAASIRGCAGSPRGGGAERAPARRQQGGRGQALLAAGRRGAQPRPQAHWPTPSTTRDRSCSRSASAIWQPAATCPTPSPTRAAPSSGRATARRCSTCASMPTSARCSSTATALARRPQTTCSSTRRRTAASTSASARRSRASSSPSRPTTTRRPRST